MNVFFNCHDALLYPAQAATFSDFEIIANIYIESERWADEHISIWEDELILMLWPQAETPGVTRVAAYHCPSDGHFWHQQRNAQFLPQGFLTEVSFVFPYSSWASYSSNVHQIKPHICHRRHPRRQCKKIKVRGIFVSYWTRNEPLFTTCHFTHNVQFWHNV